MKWVKMSTSIDKNEKNPEAKKSNKWPSLFKNMKNEQNSLDTMKYYKTTPTNSIDWIFILKLLNLWFK